MVIEFAVVKKGLEDGKGGFGDLQLSPELADIHFSQVVVCEGLHEMSSIACLLADKPNQIPQTIDCITMPVTGLAARYESTNEGMTNRRSA